MGPDRSQFTNNRCKMLKPNDKPCKQAVFFSRVLSVGQKFFHADRSDRQQNEFDSRIADFLEWKEKNQWHARLIHNRLKILVHLFCRSTLSRFQPHFGTFSFVLGVNKSNNWVFEIIANWANAFHTELIVTDHNRPLTVIASNSNCVPMIGSESWINEILVRNRLIFIDYTEFTREMTYRHLKSNRPNSTQLPSNKSGVKYNATQKHSFWGVFVTQH